MSSIKLNEVQMIDVCKQCLDEASCQGVDLTFQDAIEFLNGAIGFDFHEKFLQNYIKNFVYEREQRCYQS